MIRLAIILGFATMAIAAFSLGLETRAQIDATPTKTETLTCVRVTQVTPAGTINYLCEVRK
ncbi:MAG: hypothetical protein NTX28_07825 [Novosphingobium sp.]|nr:hypothetical protein [Novosphingobium sp.]